eukprot:TRINITY_DN5132_c0_g1_i3.p1 TRINITY_DN5132_c0_g1~~TRINITY_DN5132_c0_g1_i3.p1  ORF type:complete len:159 (-),score=23.79 TRINITY_DN5132_c0_g1_i3:644-1120(-)
MCETANEPPACSVPTGRVCALSKPTLKRLLVRCNELRFSAQYQDMYTLKDDTNWSAMVTNSLHRQALQEFGFADSEVMLDQIYSTRYVYRDDEEMQELFKTLIHVQMDFTADGPLKEGDDAVDAQLYELDGTPTSLFHYINMAKAKDVPLVVYNGSWT